MMDDYGLYTYPNRTLCDVLSDMRKAYEVRNFSGLLAMIEEIQYLGNRMEAALGDIRDLREFSRKRAELKEEIKKLVETRKALRTKESGNETE